MSLSFVQLGMGHFGSGDFHSAEKALGEAFNLSQTGKEKQNEAYSRIWLERVLRKLKELELSAVEEYILQGLRICEDLKLKPFTAQGHFFLGEVYADAGEKGNATENLGKAKEMLEEMGMHYWLAETRKVLGRV